MQPAPQRPTVAQQPNEAELAEFPLVGARARRWGRFERDLGRWLASPEGRFAAWQASRALAAPGAGAAQSSD